MEASKVRQIRFQFDVGDFVQTAWDAQTQPKTDKHLRGVWQVIERTFCQHCGGHRIQYVCRSHEAFANKQQTAAFDACELVAVEVSE
jgi:hypothetical protein